jgi:ABC-2 type transport system permease protein
VFEQTGFMGMRQLKQFPRRRPTRTDYVLAAYIHGPFAGQPAAPETPAKEGEEKKPTAKEAKVVFVADLDMISDAFFEFRRARYQGQEKFNFDNVTFVLNCVDKLAGDESFVELRKKRPQRRTLDRIARMTEEVAADARKSEEQAEVDAQAELSKAQEQLDKKVEEINKRTDIDARSKRAQIEYVRDLEQRQFDVTKARIEATKAEKIEQIHDELQAQIRAEQQRIKWMAVLIPPIPALLVGILVFFRRMSGEKEGVDPGRLIG